MRGIADPDTWVNPVQTRAWCAQYPDPRQKETGAERHELLSSLLQ
jgi:hypothetical protein